MRAPFDAVEFVNRSTVPGDIWITSVVAELADGSTIEFHRRMIIWSVDSTEFSAMQRAAVIAQWAAGAEDGTAAGEPVGDAMAVALDAEGAWIYGSLRGQLRERVSRYVPADPWTNNIDVMAAAARAQAEGAARARERWTARQCADYIGVTESTWRAYVAEGRAPQPRRDGRRNTWSAEEVRQWHRSRPRVTQQTTGEPQR